MQIKELAVDALQSIRIKNLQPKDCTSALGDYIVAEIRNLTPEQTIVVRSKLNRAFIDIMDEVHLMVRLIYKL